MSSNDNPETDTFPLMSPEQIAAISKLDLAELDRSTEYSDRMNLLLRFFETITNSNEGIRLVKVDDDEKLDHLIERDDVITMVHEFFGLDREKVDNQRELMMRTLSETGHKA